MRAAQFVGKPVFEINDVEDPVCPSGGMVIRVRAAAICGTDLKIMSCQDVKVEKGKVVTMDLPRITGHEFAGVIETVGSDVAGFEAGDRVAVGPTVPCLACAMCDKGYHEMCENVNVIGYHSDGGFAELAAISEAAVAANCVVKIPDGVSFEAASLTEPFSCAINCLELSPPSRTGATLVMGPGPLGLIMADLAKHMGAPKVFLSGTNDLQLAKSSVANIDATININKEDIEERMNELTDGMGPELVITSCPAPEAQQSAMRVVAKRGTVNFFGGLPRDKGIVSLDTNLIHYKEITVIGTHGSAPSHVAKAVELQAQGALDLSKYVERTFGLEEINEALKMAQGKGRLKVVITP